MTEKKKPKILILESNDAVRDHVESILSREGWDVTCERASKDALNTLAQSKKVLFALFISNFKLPKMEGDDILQKVKSISPLTQRMLLIPANKPDTLISAINKAEINACITSPFNDEDLIDQAKTCLKHFKHALKRQRLKRVTVYQNKQMFKIAQNLKKKDNAYKHLIDEKKAQKLMLKSKKRKAENKNDLNTNITLLSLLEHKGIRPAPDVFENEFVFICKIIKDLFDQVTTRCHSEPVSLNLGKILNKDKHSDDTADKDKDTIEPPENDQTDSKEPNGEEPDSKKNLPEDEPILPELMEKILKQAFTHTINTGVQTLSKSPEPDDIVTDMTDNILEEYFEILISEDQTKAYIKKIKDLDSNCPQLDLSDLLGLLGQKQISYGILDNEAIETWISKSFTQKIIIAKGEEAVHGRDGEIKFHFETNFTNPGKISEDGSIDFRERGEIPYIHKEDLLAVKTPPRQGKSGISVSGVPIPVDEVIDPVFIAGPGTEMTEDGLSIHAAIDGQPHLDALGTISVNPDLVIPGDVDFETGNVDFNGNIIVKGMIKEGFTVKGINLTAQEIEGGIIDLSGDLNVSAGITDSTISAHGNVYAKFINHSNIMGFGNLTISKEIIDSDIILSGSCSNQTGHIISSQITAKLGIEAGKIGTASSKPVNLKLGVNEHIEMLKKHIDQVLEACVSKTSLLKDEIKKLEDHDQALYQQISEKAHIQDRSQIEIKELKKSLPGLEKSNDLVKVQQISNEIKKLITAAKDAEKQLNTIFETQDKIANETAQFKDQIKVLEDQTKNHVIEKKALKEFSKKDKPLPVVTVAKTITQDSIIKGPHSSIILKEDTSRCKIQELASQGESLQFYEMNISDL